MLIGFDTETYLIRPGRDTPKHVVTSTFCADDNRLTGLWTDPDSSPIRSILGSTSRELVGHNVAFDMAVLSAESPDLLPLFFQALDEGRIHDTMLTQQLQYLAHGKYRFDETTGRKPSWSLQYVAKDLIDLDLSKDSAVRGNYSLYDGVPVEQWPDEFVDYALLDASAPLLCYQEQLKCPPTEVGPVVKYDTVVNLKEQVQFSMAAKLMQTWGMRTCPDTVSELKASLTAEVEHAKAVLSSEDCPAIEVTQPDGITTVITPPGLWTPLIRPGGARDMKAIRRRVAAAYNGFPPLTEKGMELEQQGHSMSRRDFLAKYTSTSSEVLADAKDPALQLLASVMSSMAELNNFIPLLERGTIYPVTPSYRTLQVTGRTSCSRPNVQNLPRRPGVRECFVARPGHAFLFCDYDSLEIRTFAQTCLDIVGHSTFAERYAEDKHFDPHSFIGAAILEVDYEQFLHLHAQGVPAAKDARRMAKVVNFGIPGGMGWRTLIEYAPAYGVHLTEEKAKWLFELWFQLCDEAEDYFAYVSEETDDWAHKIHMTERSMRQRGRCSYTQFANNGFQGPAADLAKDACYQASKQCYTDETSPLYTCRLVAFIHDELIVEAPLERLHWAGQRLSSVMEGVGTLWCPDVPLVAEAAAATYWAKEAKPVYNEFGHLVPWEDS